MIDAPHVRFRKTEPSDILTIADWIAKDAPHREIPASFFTESGDGISCYAIDFDGVPTIFVRQETEGKATRLHTQFPYGVGTRKRIANALSEAYPLVREDARERGFKSIRFETKSLALIRFMWRWNFRADLIDDL